MGKPLWFKKSWPWFLLVSSPVLLVVTLFVIGSSDIEPPDVSDLQRPRREVADKDNAYFYMMQLQAICNLKEEKDLLDEFVNSDHPFEESKLCEKIPSEAWVLWEEVLNCSSYQSPLAESLDQLFPEYGAIQRWTVLTGRRIVNSAESDEKKYNELLKLESFTLNLQTEASSLIENLVGLTVFSICQKNLSELCYKTENKKVLMKFLKRELNIAKAKKAFKDVLREEFISWDKSLWKIGEDLRKSTSVFSGKEGLQKFLLPYCYHRNRLRQFTADYNRAVESLMLLDLSVKEIDKKWQEYDERLKEDSSRWFSRIMPNGFAKSFTVQNFPQYKKMYKKNLQRENYISALKVCAAIRLFYLNEGYYPKEFSTLVPQYIEEIPKDTTTGEPILYAFDEGKVYWVGNDFVDNKADFDSDDGYVFIDAKKAALEKDMY